MKTNKLNSEKLSFPSKTAFWAGFFYILTFVSIPTLSLYQSIRQPDYITSISDDSNIVLGGILEITVALSGIITSILLYSVLKKQNQTLALGLIASRIVEAGTMFVGVAFLLGAVSLHHDHNTSTAADIARTLVNMYDRIFVLGQGFMPAINDILLGVLLFKSRLVPRGLSLIGIIGAIPLLTAYFAIMFGFIERTSILAGTSAILVALFEFSLGIVLLIKGIRKTNFASSN
jgi:hypothetical protein